MPCPENKSRIAAYRKASNEKHLSDLKKIIWLPSFKLKIMLFEPSFHVDVQGNLTIKVILGTGHSDLDSKVNILVELISYTLLYVEII